MEEDDTLEAFMRQLGIDPQRPRLEPGSRTRSTVGQVAPMLPLEAPPSRAQQRAEYDAAQRSVTRPRAAPAYQPPSNQFAEAGQYALEQTGLPSVRRSARAFASGDMETGVEEGAMGALGVGTLLAGGRGARAPRPMPDAPPMRAPVAAARGTDPEALSLARSWIDSFGGGPEAEARAISVMSDQLSDPTIHPRRRRQLEAAVASVRSRDYVRGERNSFSQRVEEAWPDIYNSAPGALRPAPDGSPPGNGDFGQRLFYRQSEYPIDPEQGPNRAVFFTPDASYASEFPRSRSPGANVIRTEANLREGSLADLRNPEHQRRVLDALAGDEMAAEHLQRRLRQSANNGTGYPDWVISADPAIRDAIERAGFSGVWLDEGRAVPSVAVFRASDIRARNAPDGSPPRPQAPDGGSQGAGRPLARLREQGFDTDAPLYRGHDGDPSTGHWRASEGMNGEGVYMTRDPASAERWALRQAENEPTVHAIYARGRIADSRDGLTFEEAREQGYSGLDYYQNGQYVETVIFDPINVSPSVSRRALSTDGGSPGAGGVPRNPSDPLGSIAAPAAVGGALSERRRQ